MTDIYEEYWHTAMNLRHQTYDLIGDHNHPVARSLQNETTQLVDDIELHKAPRAVEDRIKQIQHKLIEARAQGESVLNYTHNHDLHHHYEKMRQDVRTLPHY